MDFSGSFERFLTFSFQDSLRGRSLSVVEHCGMGEVSTSIIFFDFDNNYHYFDKDQNYNHHQHQDIISIKISPASLLPDGKCPEKGSNRPNRNTGDRGNTILCLNEKLMLLLSSTRSSCSHRDLFVIQQHHQMPFSDHSGSQKRY